MPITVDIDRSAEKQIEDLDTVVKNEVRARLDRIRADWPDVPGLKPMRGDLRNHVTEKVGDYRVLMKQEGGRLIVVKVEHRSVVYKKKPSSRDAESVRTGWVLVPGQFAEEAMRGRPTRNFAGEFIMMSVGLDLLAARKRASLTQHALAKKIRRAQSTVSMAEKGQIRVSTPYVRAVLRACGVPQTWSRRDWA